MERDLFQAFNARTGGLLPPALRTMSVLVVGAGSVGSQMVDGLVRSGVGSVTIVDGDSVEAHNLSRSVYVSSHIGRPKAECLAGHARMINSGVEAAWIDRPLQAIERLALATIVATSDLIIGATDDPDAQVKLNRIAHHHKKSAIFVGLYKGAKGGEVVVSVPGVTPCFECFSGAKRIPAGNGGNIHRSRDYGSGRLEGEVGLGADITHVTSAATKIALAILSAMTCEPGKAREFGLRMLEERLTVATFGMEPDYWFFPRVLAQAAGQFAFQSVWLEVATNDDCPGCSKRDPGDPIWTMTGPIDQGQFNFQADITEEIPA